MRILTLCHEHPPIGGGAAAVAAALARQMAAAGHEVVLVTMGFDDLAEYERLDGYELYRVACRRRRKEMASPLEGLRWARRTWRLVQRLHAQRPFDATHSHFIMPAGIVACRAKEKFGIPCVITPHGSDVPGYNRERLKLAHMIVRPWWRAICAKADCIASPSASLLQLIRQTTTHFRGTVIPNGFESGRFEPREKERRILLCSRLVERKGFHTFLAAIRHLDLPGWEIDIVGDGPMAERLRELAAQCRTPVRLHGWIDNRSPRLAELYGRAMIFAFPSEWENFSIALLEAMSAGCAVIATDVAGNPEVVGDTGCLVPVDDADALRDAVLRLTADPDCCRQLGERARQRALAQFNWQVLARRYLDLLQRSASSATEPADDAGEANGAMLPSTSASQHSP